MGDKVYRNCDNCGKEYIANSTRVKFGRNLTCSKVCSDTIKYANLRKEKLEVKCAYCGKPKFISKQPTPHKFHFCNAKCKALAMRLDEVLYIPKRKRSASIDGRSSRIYYKYRSRDKERDGGVDYTLEEYKLRINSSKCFYCDAESGLGLDRIDNSKGHSLQNTVVCCELCNMTRGDRFTHDEFKLLGEVINEIRTRR